VTSHQVAKILLANPDAPVVVKKPAASPFHRSGQWCEVSSITFSNYGQFIDSNGGFGDDYNSGRECVEIK
jgi:hypothetical protein